MLMAIFSLNRLFKKQPENFGRPQKPGDGQEAIAKILEMSGCSDLRIDEHHRLYTVKDGKRYWVMFKPNKENCEIFGTEVLFETNGKNLSWKDLSPELCDRLVLESLCGTFFGYFTRKRIVFLPEAKSIAEFILKLDLLESIYISYSTLSDMSFVPNWFYHIKER